MRVDYTGRMEYKRIYKMKRIAEFRLPGLESISHYDVWWLVVEASRPAGSHQLPAGTGRSPLAQPLPPRPWSLAQINAHFMPCKRVNCTTVSPGTNCLFGIREMAVCPTPEYLWRYILAAGIMINDHFVGCNQFGYDPITGANQLRLATARGIWLHTDKLHARQLTIWPAVCCTAK